MPRPGSATIALIPKRRWSRPPRAPYAAVSYNDEEEIQLSSNLRIGLGLVPRSPYEQCECVPEGLQTGWTTVKQFMTEAPRSDT